MGSPLVPVVVLSRARTIVAACVCRQRMVGQALCPRDRSTPRPLRQDSGRLKERRRALELDGGRGPEASLHWVKQLLFLLQD